MNPDARALGDSARAADCFRGGSREEFHQWWKTRFEGESGIDQGGLFRQTISDINDELVRRSPTRQSRAGLGLALSS